MRSKPLREDPQIAIYAYEPGMRAELEEFRRHALAERSGSLTVEKLDPDRLDGRLLACFSEGRIISVSVAERSHYTGDPEIACRICRYHVLEFYRVKFNFCGFKMLRLHCDWADRNGFQVVYWTHDIRNRALNMLYQKRRRYSLGVSSEWFSDPAFEAFELHPSLLFKVTEKTDMLQFIYYRRRDPNFVWRPTERVVRYDAAERSTQGRVQTVEIGVPGFAIDGA